MVKHTACESTWTTKSIISIIRTKIKFHSTHTTLFNTENILALTKYICFKGISFTGFSLKRTNNVDNTAFSLYRGLYAINHRDYYLHTLPYVTSVTYLNYLCTKSLSSYRCSTPSTNVNLRTQHKDEFPALNNVVTERTRISSFIWWELQHHLPKTDWMVKEENWRNKHCQAANLLLVSHPTQER